MKHIGSEMIFETADFLTHKSINTPNDDVTIVRDIETGDYGVEISKRGSSDRPLMRRFSDCNQAIRWAEMNAQFIVNKRVRII
jgi:hypothetical protein|tara:strand:- start:242 stop:490 length:249 start_codon:yes stop_codon:yes gene_type:complete